jgi:hypothetical protein
MVPTGCGAAGLWIAGGGWADTVAVSSRHPASRMPFRMPV